MATPTGPVRFEVTFTGRVQGVGFRYTVLQLARGRPVTGYVRNLPDGNVELVGEGSKEALKSFVDAIQREMGGYVANTRVGESPATGEFHEFSIRH
jgi:acylphosphatase